MGDISRREFLNASAARRSLVDRGMGRAAAGGRGGGRLAQAAAGEDPRCVRRHRRRVAHADVRRSGGGQEVQRLPCRRGNSPGRRPLSSAAS